MSNKNLEHKRMLIAKCYELAILEHRTKFVDEWVSSEVDDHAMSYLDKVMKAADHWGEAEVALRSEDTDVRPKHRT